MLAVLVGMFITGPEEIVIASVVITITRLLIRKLNPDSFRPSRTMVRLAELGEGRAVVAHRLVIRNITGITPKPCPPSLSE